MNIEARPDSWSAFSPDLRKRIRAAGTAELESLLDELWSSFTGLMLAIREEYAISPQATEREFEGATFGHECVLRDDPDLPLLATISAQLDATDARWRLDVLSAALTAIEDVVHPEDADGN